MAANVSLKPPGKFDFRYPDEWLKWKCCFTRYFTATGLEDESEARKTSNLLYCMEEEGDEVLSSITDDDRRVYTTALDTFNTLFKVRRNAIF